ncbi:phosphopentomutase [Mycoplasma nasistruthionis]|uniref:Phosphopentomutase n=1 Tax=Mycoplasma nasistruthionis TaxID=353852 RepID=A0A4Y6I6E9_9MOLU|nr:phosphopentomutase [Mycoplasma nasistruthionis]QDF64952.1 phosphopentomutase [Mycoplasma nasistruthionis]
MAKFKRVFMIVTDGLGIGPDKDQKRFGDDGANTIRSASMVEEFKIDTWKKLGIGNITDLNGNYKVAQPMAYMAKVQEVSNAKDTLAGHWEMMGIKTMVPFPTFAENGFPQELIDELSKAFDGRPIVGNKAASGTEIINELAHREKAEGAIIVYTSNDSVLQICGHEEWTGLDNLYKYAKAARQICSSRPEWNVGRIIARPYIGEERNYTRTFNRHDYANKPHEMTLNRLQEKGVEVISVGKINDIFVGQGITRHLPSGSDAAGLDITIDLAKTLEGENKFVFTNLVQFDSHFGHRRNVHGFGQNIADLDAKLGVLVNALREDDLLIMTSDHGNDPLFPGFNHTREYLPATIYSKSFKSPKVLPVINGLGTLGNIIAKNFGAEMSFEAGEDIFEKLQ